MKQQQRTQRDTINRRQRIPERTCLGCGIKRAPQTLLRLICSPQNTICLDQSGHASGRGTYICSNVTCLRKALKPAKLTFAFKHAVIVPEFETLCKDITTLHYTRLKTCLQLACKAGAVVSGHTALQKAMGQGQVVGVMLATDISASQAQAYCDWCERHNIFCCWFFSQQELGQFLGKPSRSAIGLTELRFAERLCMLMTSVEQWQVSHSVSEGRTAFLHTTS